MASIFTRIINGEIPCYKIAETDRYFAFLDINPVTPGHTLVVPKHEVSYLFDLTDEEYAGLQLFAKRVALGLQEAVPCKRIGRSPSGGLACGSLPQPCHHPYALTDKTAFLSTLFLPGFRHQ